MLKINVTKVAHFSGHKGSIFSLCEGIYSDTFFSGADDGYIVEWNVKTKTDGHLLVQVNRPVYSILLQTQKHLLLCGTAGGNLHVIDLKDKKEIRNIEAHQLGLFDIKETTDWLITVGGDGCIRIWEKDSLDLITTIKASDKSARCIALHPLLPLFAVGYSDCFIRIYNIGDFREVYGYKAHNNSVFALCYSPDGKWLYSGGRDVMLKNWNVEESYSGNLNIPAHTLHINDIKFSPDGSLFATVSMDKTVKIWDATTNQLCKVIDYARNDGHRNSVNKVVWLSNKQLITCSDDRTIMIWELEIN
jgi:WD40 repeat protein